MLKTYTNSVVKNIISSYSRQKKLINQCYTHSSIQKRIDSLRQFSPDMIKDNFQENQLKLPFEFKMTNAKNLYQFHKLNKTQGNIVILHSLAFIQLNAFLAYMDTYFRFSLNKQKEVLWGVMDKKSLQSFRKQLKRIALDEGQHCLLLAQRLEQLGHKFGQLPVISNLNNIVYQTKQNLLERLALISIVHEGRGIKSISKLINKLHNLNDTKSIQILKRIQSEQSYHFETGLKWFKYFTQKQFRNERAQIQGQQQKLTQFYQQLIDKINNKYKVSLQMNDLKMG